MSTLSPIDRESEQTIVDEIDKDELERHVDALSDLVRTSGTEDERIASKYIVDTLRDYGVEADYLEYDGYISVPEFASVDVTVPTSREITDCISVSFGASTPQAGVHAPVVSLSDVTAEELERTDIEGRIVLVSGLPTPHPVGLLEKSGAAGVIFVSPTNDELHEMIVSPVWGTPDSTTVSEIPSLPVVELSQSEGEWLRERVDRGPVELTLHTSVTTEVTSLPCPVGRIEGRESDRYFVVGNHVDSWHEGATDNATAIATTLEVARLFAEREPRRGIVFGFWSAHSTGRYAGSAWYADEHWLDLRKNGVAYLHIDLPGLKGADELWYQHMAELEAEHLDAMRTVTDFDLQEGVDSWLGSSDRPARNSDQSFWGTGLSSLLSGARLEPETEDGGPIGGGWWWHTPEDTRDKVDLDVLVEETKLYVALTSRLCGSPVLPHDFTASVEDIRDVLDDVEQTTALPVDFSATRDRLETLEASLEEFNSHIETTVSTEDRVAQDIEDVQVEVGNVLIPALYMARAPYEQEPALPYERLPGMRIEQELTTEQDRRFAEVSLKRAQNRLDHHINRAQRTVNAFLSTQE